MMMPSPHPESPKVSVVTPVFNGEKYLRTCIESVLAQTYDNWDYTIVDNCSTDNSLAIAREYAEQHPQIHVETNSTHVGVVESHNRAFRAMSGDAKYCKLVSADDWLYPECVSRLVALAERYPSIGVVASYSARTTGVPWTSLPLTKEVFAGHEVGRSYLLGEIGFLFVPSTVLYRASLVRATDAFFPGSAPSADVEAALRCLTQSDLGFVHQILSFERRHDDAITVKMGKTHQQYLDALRTLIEFGPEFLTESEQRQRVDEWLSVYFKQVAVGCVNLQGLQFWRLHRDGLRELGYSIYDRRLVMAVIGKALDLILNPKATAEKGLRRVRSRRSSLRPAGSGGDPQPGSVSPA
jgi:glycosyltransferase involved in cell wall biosynthesis